MKDLKETILTRLGIAAAMGRHAKAAAGRLQQAAAQTHDGQQQELAPLRRQIEAAGVGNDEAAEERYCRLLVERMHMIQAHTLSGMDAARMPELGAPLEKGRRPKPTGMTSLFEEEEHPREAKGESMDGYKPGEFVPKEGPRSKAFREWFGASAVVDEHGEPAVVYHGSTEKFDRFDPQKLLSTTHHADYGLGFYFSPRKELAEEFALKQDPQTGEPLHPGYVYPVYLSIQKPWRAEDPLTLPEWRRVWNALPADGLLRTAGAFLKPQVERTLRAGVAGVARKQIVFTYFSGHLPPPERSRAWREMRKALESLGYDGVAGDGEWVAWQPEQIKHAENHGAFDPANPSMFKARGYPSFVPPDMPQWPAERPRPTESFLPLNQVENKLKMEQMAAAMRRGQWVWNVPLVRCGDQLLTGSHRYAAAKVARVPLQTVPVDDLFREGGLDFKATWEQHQQPYDGWLSNMDYALQCLPAELREKYGLDLG